MGFIGNLCALKLNKEQTNKSDIVCLQYFCGYQQVVLKHSYHLYSILFTSSTFSLTSLFASNTTIVCSLPHCGESYSSPPTSTTIDSASNAPGQGWFICCLILFSIRICIRFLDPTIVCPLGVIHCRNFRLRPIFPYLSSFSYPLCHTYSFLNPAPFHLLFLLNYPPHTPLISHWNFSPSCDLLYKTITMRIQKNI